MYIKELYFFGGGANYRNLTMERSRLDKLIIILRHTYMEPEESLLCSEVPSTGLYPEVDESNQILRFSVLMVLMNGESACRKASDITSQPNQCRKPKCPHPLRHTDEPAMPVSSEGAVAKALPPR
jgi:hypothetical protein